MNGYKEKMNRYRHDKETMIKLKEYCFSTRDYTIIKQALANTFHPDDIINDYMFKHVTIKNYEWAKLECDALPCCRDTFRLYRAKFFYNLNERLKEVSPSEPS